MTLKLKLDALSAITICRNLYIKVLNLKYNDNKISADWCAIPVSKTLQGGE
jgi:hypothetical protein